MEKKVWIFRHGKKESGAQKNVIAPEMALKNPEGIEQTRRIAEGLKGQIFETIFTSPLVRAYQTGVIFALVLGMDFPKIAAGLAGVDALRWDPIIPLLKGDTCLDIYEVAPNLMEEDGGEVFKTITSIAKTLGPGEHTLAISHGGFIEPALATALLGGRYSFKEVLGQIPDLKEGEAIIFLFDDENHFVGYEEKRFA